jgi:hypothetical protein
MDLGNGFPNARAHRTERLKRRDAEVTQRFYWGIVLWLIRISHEGHEVNEDHEEFVGAWHQAGLMTMPQLLTLRLLYSL